MNKSILVGVLTGGITAFFVSAGVLFFGQSYFIPTSQNLEEIDSEMQNEFVEKVSDVRNVDGIYSEEDLIVGAVEKSNSAVVSIVIEKDVPVIFGNQANSTQRREVGGGSGFIVSEDGFVVTNKHVVDDEDAEYIVFVGLDEYPAEVIAKDPFNDIAILKIETEEEMPYLEFGDSEELKLGQTVIAIGNPLLEFANSVSVGVVSGLSRSIIAGDGYGNSEQLESLIQTDAAINPGNSGGPLLNSRGEVIGVNVAVASGENIGFSLPGNVVKKVVDSVKGNGRIIRPFLGVRYFPVTERLQEANNLDVDYGVLLIKGDDPEALAVVPGSPADKAGLEENDIILEIDGEKLEEDVSFARLIASKTVGEVVELKVLHDGKEKIVEVILEEFDED